MLRHLALACAANTLMTDLQTTSIPKSCPSESTDVCYRWSLLDILISQDYVVEDTGSCVAAAPTQPDSLVDPIVEWERIRL
jgi:hypothetical protein